MEGCERCGAMVPLKKRKGKYHFVCDKCKKELDKRLIMDKREIDMFILFPKLTMFKWLFDSYSNLRRRNKKQEV